jgi:hypothetical protein
MLRQLNRHGASCALLIAILILGSVAHRIAISTITILSDIPTASLPTSMAHNIAGILFLDANWWIPLAYLLLFFSILVYMELRSTPRWAVQVTFLFMSMPAVGYITLCLRAGTQSFVAMSSNIQQ